MNPKICTTICFLSLAFTCGVYLHSQTIDKANTEQKYLEKARQNIEQYRKGSASVALVDAQGKPLKNIRVEIDQVSQDFLFGNLAFEMIPGEEEPYNMKSLK
jgi:endo-1,4-beta-xylanase